MPRSANNGLAIIPIDVSELEPPEPMERIFVRLRQLQAGQLLRVRHQPSAPPVNRPAPGDLFEPICQERHRRQHHGSTEDQLKRHLATPAVTPR